MVNDAAGITGASSLDGKAIADLAEQLNQFLRLRTFPIGMSCSKTRTRWQTCPDCASRRRDALSTCQPVMQSRMAGFALGITTENIPSFSSCPSVIGLDAPGER
jgi:uncharacterized protein (DUF169 family)